MGFQDSASVGVKAANLATLRTLGFSDGVVPNGYAVPFALYDEFMKYNGFYAMAEDMRNTPDFRNDTSVREALLGRFRDALAKGKMPERMMLALGKVQAAFGKGLTGR